VFEGLARDPQFARRMLAGMSRKLHSLVSDLESVTLKSGRERVIGYLLRQEGGGDAADSPYSVSLPVSKAIVASRLNLTPEHFSRILHELVAEGLIEVDGRDIRIVDPVRLRQMP
jgi:CRP-like cAMP-binding protein